jgi:lipoprotein-releasing system ATP-binding protein
MSEALLRATGVMRSFRSSHRLVEVLRGVDLEVFGGETVAVTGASGSGKSTLLNLLGSLDRPDAGSILWEGEDMSGWSWARRSRFRNRELGFVFQHHYLLGDFTAVENVLMPARIRGLGPEDAKRAAELLDALGMSGRLDHLPGELSGGEQQRVAVARALQNRPRLLLLDEPGGNLDRRRAADLHGQLLALARSESVAVLAVTHSRDLAERADRQFRLVEGCLRQLEPGSTQV